MINNSGKFNMPLSTTEVARSLGVAPWQVRALIRRGLINDPPRLGRDRMFPREWLPIIAEALRQAGYLSCAAREGAADAR